MNGLSTGLCPEENSQHCYYLTGARVIVLEGSQLQNLHGSFSTFTGPLPRGEIIKLIALVEGLASFGGS